MSNNAILTMLALVSLGISLVCLLLKSNVAKEIGYVLLFLSVVLLAISSMIRLPSSLETHESEDALPTCNSTIGATTDFGTAITPRCPCDVIDPVTGQKKAGTYCDMGEIKCEGKEACNPNIMGTCHGSADYNGDPIPCNCFSCPTSTGCCGAAGRDSENNKIPANPSKYCRDPPFTCTMDTSARQNQALWEQGVCDGGLTRCNKDADCGQDKCNPLAGAFVQDFQATGNNTSSFVCHLDPHQYGPGLCLFKHMQKDDEPYNSCTHQCRVQPGIKECVDQFGQEVTPAITSTSNGKKYCLGAPGAFKNESESGHPMQGGPCSGDSDCPLSGVCTDTVYSCGNDSAILDFSSKERQTKVWKQTSFTRQADYALPLYKRLAGNCLMMYTDNDGKKEACRFADGKWQHCPPYEAPTGKYWECPSAIQCKDSKTGSVVTADLGKNRFKFHLLDDQGNPNPLNSCATNCAQSCVPKCSTDADCHSSSFDGGEQPTCNDQGVCVGGCDQDCQKDVKECIQAINLVMGAPGVGCYALSADCIPPFEGACAAGCYAASALAYQGCGCSELNVDTPSMSHGNRHASPSLPPCVPNPLAIAGAAGDDPK